MDQILTLLKVIIIGGLLALGNCQIKKQSVTTSKQIDGVSFVSSPRKPGNEVFNSVKQLNAGWISLMPYAFSYKDSSQIWYDTKGQWWGEKTEGIIEYTRLAKEQGLKIMLKPHLWIIRGGFTGKLSFTTKEKWAQWEQAYQKYILHHARLADSLHIELFCLGTELESFVKARPAFWPSFIKKVKAAYKGKLTYAANWDEYKRFPYWKQMDYIGIDAYFPLSKEQTPSPKQLHTAWTRWTQEIQGVHQKYNKPVLFTEFGYRSIYQTAAEPWVSNKRKQPVNLQGQVNALNALFETFTPQPWFAGGFIWKWFDLATSGYNIDPKTHTGYSPQNKPAEKLLKKWYTKLGNETVK